MSNIPSPVLLLLSICLMYFFVVGFCCCVFDVSTWAVQKLGQDRPTEKAKSPALFAVTGILFALLTGLLHPEMTKLIFYLWIALRALGAATFLYICGLGLYATYLDLRIWMIRRRERLETRSR
jgi:protein-S-isoprenylcysteine O-methyltransferase Ste14